MRIDFLLRKVEEHAQKAVSGFNLFQEKKERIYFNNLAMECFQASNYMIDLAEEIISLRSLGYPSSYADGFSTLHAEGIISENEKNTLMRMVMLRNRIAHDYHIISEKELVELAGIMDGLPELSGKLAKAIKAK